LSGYSGFSGANPGASGYSGFCGLSGYSGFCGLSGYSGFCGLSGYSGFCGLSGYSGFCGLSGYSGFCGLSGYSGFCGLSGYSGFCGLSGYSGFCGLSGYSGFSGTPVTYKFLDSIEGAVPIALASGQIGSLFFQPFDCHGVLSATRLDFMLNIASTSNSVAGFSINLGFYSLNGSTLSLATSISASYSWSSFSNSSQSSIATAWGGYSSIRFYPIASNINLTGGNWWIASVINSSGNAINFTNYGQSTVAAIIQPSGATTIASVGGGFGGNVLMPFWGVSNATTTAVPSSVNGTVTSFLSGQIVSEKTQWFLLTSILS
jgi:hypothetical protein